VFFGESFVPVIMVRAQKILAAKEIIGYRRNEEVCEEVLYSIAVFKTSNLNR
jgi:hypothetical protein